MENETLLAEIYSTEEKVWSLLEKARGMNSVVGLNVNAPEYKEAYNLTSALCERHFKELYESVFAHSSQNDYDLFISRPGDDYSMYYYNPDSTAGGQIVQCPFDEEQGRRMLAGEEQMDVLAENTQYLSDINTVHFFDTVFVLMCNKALGNYLGTDISDVFPELKAEKSGPVISVSDAEMQNMADRADLKLRADAKNMMRSLDSQIKSAEERQNSSSKANVDKNIEFGR